MRHDRLLQERLHDPYRAHGKLQDLSLCPSCGAVYRAGRWQWRGVWAKAEAERAICPACRRAEDHCPAGILTVEGPFVRENRGQVMALCFHLQGREAADHPMSRIIGVEPYGDGFRVSTSDTHLPRRLGHGLRRAFRGRLTFHRSKGNTLPRVEWRC